MGKVLDGHSSSIQRRGGLCAEDVINTTVLYLLSRVNKVLHFLFVIGGVQMESDTCIIGEVGHSNTHLIFSQIKSLKERSW